MHETKTTIKGVTIVDVKSVRCVSERVRLSFIPHLLTLSTNAKNVDNLIYGSCFERSSQ
jgi:hypothetical protein